MTFLGLPTPLPFIRKKKQSTNFALSPLSIQMLTLINHVNLNIFRFYLERRAFEFQIIFKIHTHEKMNLFWSQLILGSGSNFLPGRDRTYSSLSLMKASSFFSVREIFTCGRDWTHNQDHSLSQCLEFVVANS